MSSFQVIKPAVVRLVILVACVSAIACVDTATAPRTPAARRALRDTVGDSTVCLSGWIVINGVITCS